MGEALLSLLLVRREREGRTQGSEEGTKRGREGVKRISYFCLKTKGSKPGHEYELPCRGVSFEGDASLLKVQYLFLPRAPSRPCPHVCAFWPDQEIG